MITTVWRIVQFQHVNSAFDGEGARLYGGRWNHSGVPMVYAADSKPLALLELLVHVESHLLLETYACIPAEFDDSIVRILGASHLPPHWNRYPAPMATKDLGTLWAQKLESAVLQVPSSLVPEQRNYLLNPKHPDFVKITIGRPESLRIDPRLKKRS